MSKFKITDFKIKSEGQSSNEFKIEEMEDEKTLIVKTFEVKTFEAPAVNHYSQVKSKYGPLAATDSERSSRSQKDRRFSLNPLLRNPLSVEQEELRVLDTKVQEKVDALSEEVKRNAVSEGYNEGYKQGFEEAYKKTQVEARESLARLQNLVTQFEAAKTEVFRANEHFLCEIIYRIARTVILKEVSSDSQYLLRLASELISRMGIRDHIKIIIHPKDAESLDTLKEGLLNSLGELRNLQIEVSNKVKIGGCHVETEWSAIDASIETQLQSILEALIGKNGGGA